METSSQDLKVAGDFNSRGLRVCSKVFKSRALEKTAVDFNSPGAGLTNPPWQAASGWWGEKEKNPKTQKPTTTHTSMEGAQLKLRQNGCHALYKLRYVGGEAEHAVTRLPPPSQNQLVNNPFRPLGLSQTAHCILYYCLFAANPDS